MAVSEATTPRNAVALAVALGGVALLIGQAQLRQLEASMSAGIMRLTDLSSAQALGPTVFFVHGPRWIGYTVTSGCTAALLIAPFFFIGAAMLLFQKLRVGQTLVALAIVSVLIWLVNQCRLLLIGTSMRVWGFQTGYDRSHVLAGGVLSTIGVAIGVVAFLALLLREGRDHPNPSRGSER